jgi:retron-type reverse transcriptase
VAALEDKIVQSAVVEVLNAVYERDFLGLSYGFRPGRSAHQALDTLATALCRQKVNWVLDADISAYFDTIDHAWLMKMLEHRIGDNRLLRLIAKWLKAGVVDSNRWKASKEGTPQGAVISPLLACQRVPALCARPVGGAGKKTARLRRSHHGAVCR